MKKMFYIYLLFLFSIAQVFLSHASFSRELRLFTAIDKSDLLIVKNIINNSSWQVISTLKDVKCLRSFFSFNPLHAAVKKKNKKVLDILLLAEEKDLIVALEQKNCRGLTPLAYAAKKGLYDLTKVLLEAGANPNTSDNKRYTPLHYAVKKANMKLVNLLLDHNAQVDAIAFTLDKKEIEPLHFIIDEKLTPSFSEEVRLELLRKLLSAGLDVNRQMDHGDTLLHWALENNYKEIVIFLLQDADADILYNLDNQYPFQDWSTEQLIGIFGQKIADSIIEKMPINKPLLSKSLVTTMLVLPLFLYMIYSVNR